MNRKHPLYLEDIEHVISVNGIEALNNKTVLITGASGLIGTCLIDALMALCHRGYSIKIVAVGRNRERLENRFGGYLGSSWFQILIQDVVEPFSNETRADFIFPLASNTHPVYYSKYPIETIISNIKGVENALDLASRCGSTVLYPSSVEIYGNARGEDVFSEDYTGLLNLSTSRACYTESKRVCEALCQSYISEKGTDVKIARLSRVFGPTILPSDSKASSQFINKAVAGEDIVLKSEGNQIFSYSYVADAANAILFIALNGQTGVPYNISNQACDVKLRDFAGYCASYVDRNVVFELPSDVERKGYSVATYAVLDNSRLQSAGWRPKYSIVDAIQRTITILRDED